MDSVFIVADWISGLLFAGALAMTALKHKEMRAAKIMIWCAVGVCCLRWVIWEMTNHPWYIRAIVGAMLGGFLFAAIPAALNWINGQHKDGQAEAESNSPVHPPPKAPPTPCDDASYLTMGKGNSGNDFQYKGPPRTGCVPTTKMQNDNRQNKIHIEAMPGAISDNLINMNEGHGNTFKILSVNSSILPMGPLAKKLNILGKEIIMHGIGMSPEQYKQKFGDRVADGLNEAYLNGKITREEMDKLNSPTATYGVSQIGYAIKDLGDSIMEQAVAEYQAKHGSDPK